jgi:hypothetical protein
MPEKGLFLQNHIAVIWDFDKTLSPHYMQTPLFEAYGVDEAAFWKEVNALPAYYARAGITVNEDTCYLGHVLTYVQEGIMPGLSNARLRELGGQIALYPGVEAQFDRLKTVLAEPAYVEGDLHLEHYVVSTGLAEMVRGSKIAGRLAGIYGSEFIETPALPGEDLSGAPKPGHITQIAGFLSNTTKTRAIFEINKGVNKWPHITVNSTVPEEERRIPFRNMIYVADGPSDIPSFSVVREHKGLAYAVYDPNVPEHFEQVVQLQREGRVDGYGPADYHEGGHTDMWLRLQVRKIAERMMAERKRSTVSKVSLGPTHLTE